MLGRRALQDEEGLSVEEGGRRGRRGEEKKKSEAGSVVGVDSNDALSSLYSGIVDIYIVPEVVASGVECAGERDGRKQGRQGEERSFRRGEQVINQSIYQLTKQSGKSR